MAQQAFTHVPVVLRPGEWSYDGLDVNEQVEDGLKFSADLAHYHPRCSHCHRQRDIGGMKNHMAFMADDLVVRVVAEYEAGGITQVALAAKYGISQPTVSTLGTENAQVLSNVIAEITPVRLP